MRKISPISPICPMSPMSPISPIRLIGLIILISLTACQSEDTESVDKPKQTTMELMSFSTSFLDVEPWVTRADPDFNFPTGYTDHLPDGYQSYEELHPHASIDDSTIGVFMTPESANPTGDFIYQGVDNGVSVWKSTIVVEKDKQYYIYGFMPRSGAESASIASLNGTGGDDFANGAVITLNNYAALTTADVSVIVGLRWATADEKINGTKLKDVPLGYFNYVGQEDGDNRLFVLLKHIYAGLHFATAVDPVYAALRSIRITKVELTAVNIRPTVNLRITLTANNTGTDPLTNVEYLPTSTPTENMTISLYEKTDATDDLGEEVPVYVPNSTNCFKDFLGCLVPASTNSFVLKTTYDVYDKNVTTEHPEGNLIRKDCVAENIINPEIVEHFPNLGAGELFTINLLIKPTYLYVMSDPDLDNPTITIQ